MTQNALQLAGFVVLFALIIFVHEFGHLLAAKRVGVKVEEFSIGFPLPGLKGLHLFDWSGTRFTLNWLPLGGYVKPIGEDDPDIEGGLAAAPKSARLAVLSAGSLTNLAVGYAVLVVGFRLGWPDRVLIADVAPGSPAEAAGIRPGDLVIWADEEDIHYRHQLSEFTFRNLGREVRLVMERDGAQYTASLVPRRAPPEGEGPMGIYMDQAIITGYSWPTALRRASEEVVYQITSLIHLPGRLIRGELPLDAARPCGPVCLNDLYNQAVDTAQFTHQWYPLFQLVGAISVAIALTNLLPLPALDGGRIAFVLVELARGRRIAPEREALVHIVGMAMLLALMAVITYQDVVNPIVPR